MHGGGCPRAVDGVEDDRKLIRVQCDTLAAMHGQGVGREFVTDLAVLEACDDHRDDDEGGYEGVEDKGREGDEGGDPLHVVLARPERGPFIFLYPDQLAEQKSVSTSTVPARVVATGTGNYSAIILLIISKIRTRHPRCHTAPPLRSLHVVSIIPASSSLYPLKSS